MNNKFKIIVVGGGHAGIEACVIVSKLKQKVMLITDDIENIGKMSCNPSIGGIGKGQLVKEIDIMGGSMAFIADISGVNFKTLNSSKGLAVQSTRVQTDKFLYKLNNQIFLKNLKNLYIYQDSLYKIIVKKNKIYAIETKIGLVFRCDCLILTTGTFLRSSIYIGDKKIKTDIFNKNSRSFLSDQLLDFLGNRGRFKTGTPPRLKEETIDFSKLNVHNSEKPTPFLSFRSNLNNFKNQYSKIPEKINCYSTNTNYYTHDIILENINKSSKYSGLITCKGPRYCPSIEDKVFKFPKRKHNIFLEKESHFSNEIYPSGLSNSLPAIIQEKFLKTIKGLENSVFTRYGYSIEYDYFDPKNLKNSLESKKLSGLFMAGQINGTTGYEEAASQGIISGICAVFKLKGKTFNFLRKDGYLGVLVDDLIKYGVDEPYRMFTSRSEYRLESREDNADIRLIKKAKKIKTLDKNSEKFITKKRKRVFKIIKICKNTFVKNKSVFNLIRDNKFDEKSFLSFFKTDFKCLKSVFSEIKYSNYIKKEKEKNRNLKKSINLIIKDNINFSNLKTLTNETLERIKLKKPKYFSDIKKIPGIRKSEILDIYFFLKKTIFFNRNNI